MKSLKKIKTKLNLTFIVIFSIIFAIYVSEVYLYKSYKKASNIYEKRISKANELNISFDKRLKIDVIKDYQDNGIQVKPTTHPINYINNKLFLEDEILPLAGISKILTIYNNENGYFVEYISDRYGFNNDDTIWDKEKHEFVFVGDSFVHGAGVRKEENLIGHFFDKTGIKPLNLGIGGNGPLLEYSTLIEYLDTNKTDNLIWFYYEGNDLENLSAEVKSKLLLKYLSDGFSQNLVHKQSDIDKMLNRYISEQEKKYKEIRSNFLVNILKLRQIRKLFFNNKSNIDYNNFSNILEKVNQIAINNGIKLYFVYLPSYERYLNNKKNDKNFKDKEIIINLVNRQNIDIIDIEKEISTNITNPLSLYPLGLDGHFNNKGNEFIIITIIKNIMI